MKRKCIWIPAAAYQWLRDESERTGVPMTRILARLIDAAQTAQTKGSSQ